jgi:hypothetical protein
LHHDASQTRDTFWRLLHHVNVRAQFLGSRLQFIMMRRIDQVLLDAAERGDLETAKGALESGANLLNAKTKNEYGSTRRCFIWLAEMDTRRLPHSY